MNSNEFEGILVLSQKQHHDAKREKKSEIKEVQKIFQWVGIKLFCVKSPLWLFKLQQNSQWLLLEHLAYQRLITRIWLRVTIYAKRALMATHSNSFDINIGLIAYFNSLIDLSLDKHHNYLP